MAEITRNLFDVLRLWYFDSNRKPLILRGARQVGKSYLVRSWAEKNFSSENFLEINFEELAGLKEIFNKDLDIERILDELTLYSGKPLKSGSVFIFFDEVQACPQAIMSLRYFYEKAPHIPIIAAGSLLEFVLQEISFPVGRTSSLYVRPISFLEYLDAVNKSHIRTYLQDIQQNILRDDTLKIPEHTHSELLQELKKYLIIGGMPKALSMYLETRDLSQVGKIHAELLQGYVDDFPKYAKKSEWEILKTIFEKVPFLVATSKIKYSHIDKDLRTEKIKNALILLEYAGLITKVTSTNAKDLPLNSQAKLSTFKLLFLDVGLLHHALGFDWSKVSAESDLTDIHKGKFAEQFVGQEMLANSPSNTKNSIYYWNSPKYHSDAEVDYVIDFDGGVTPLEVKSGARGTLKSLTEYIKQFEPKVSFVLSQRNIEHMQNTLFLPLYMAGVLK